MAQQPAASNSHGTRAISRRSAGPPSTSSTRPTGSATCPPASAESTRSSVTAGVTLTSSTTTSATGSGSSRAAPEGSDSQMTLRQAAQILKMPVRAVEGYARRGELQGARTQYGWRFTRQDLDAFWEPCPEWSFGSNSSEE